MKESMPTVFNKRGAAKALGISIETLDRYKKAGKLSYHRIGDRIIYTDSDLTDFLKACVVPARVLPTDRESQEMQRRHKQ